MSSFSVPGDIPLPPQPAALTVNDVVPTATHLSSTLASTASIAGSSTSSFLPTTTGMAYPTTYDPQTLAYYNAYYAQYNSMMAANYGSSVLPATVPVTANLLPQSGVVGYDHTATTLTRATSNGFSGDTNGGNTTTAVNVSGVSDDDDDVTIDRGANRASQKGTPLGCWGNEKTMNLNQLLLTNIQQSQYFKVTLYSLKTLNEVIDEIWYNVKHLEPWERGSRKVSPSIFIILEKNVT